MNNKRNIINAFNVLLLIIINNVGSFIDSTYDYLCRLISFCLNKF